MIVTEKGCHAFSACEHPECEVERQRFRETSQRFVAAYYSRLSLWTKFLIWIGWYL